MGASVIPPLPPGFTLDGGTPPLPPGFTLDKPKPAAQEPEGFWRKFLGAAIEPNLALATGAVAAPISGLAGIGATVGNAMGLTDADPGETVKRVASGLTYSPATQGGQNAMSVIGYPFQKIAEAADEAGGRVTDLTGSPKLGAAVNTGINLLPSAVGGAMAPKGVPSTITKVSEAMSRKLMGSALKPSKADWISGDAGKAVRTMLDEGVNATEGGMIELRGKVNETNAKIKDALMNSNAYVAKDAVLRRMDSAKDKARRQVNPQGDLAAIEEAAQQFASHPDLPLNAIPIQKAQELKQGTYRALGDKAYGEVKTGSAEGQKQLARGLKEQIVQEEPSIGLLNARESELINALKMVEQRAAVDMNKNPVGLGAVTPSPSKMALFLADRSALIKSLLARGLNPGKGLGISDEMALYSAVPQSFSEDSRKRKELIEALMKRGQP